MEEKLYFEPSGQKKKTKEKNSAAKKTINVIVFIILIGLGVIIYFALKGKNTSSGKYPDNIRSEALICKSTEIKYPKIDYEDTNGRELELKLTFKEDGELNENTLTYTLMFKNEDEVRKAEAKAHADFNLGLNKLGYTYSEFNNVFARYSNKLIISLFGNKSNIDEYKASYFMLDGDNLPHTIEEYNTIYQEQGFKCDSSKK